MSCVDSGVRYEVLLSLLPPGLVNPSPEMTPPNNYNNTLNTFDKLSHRMRQQHQQLREWRLTPQSDDDVEARYEHDARSTRIDAFLESRRLVLERRQIVSVTTLGRSCYVHCISHNGRSVSHTAVRCH